MTKRANLGRYEILDEIGRGAMGKVYRARDPKIDRIVAIKTISLAGLETEEEQEYRERFFVEAQAAGRLSHPGIVTIFDAGEEPETHEPYIVMEYVAGQSLKQLLDSKERKIPLDSALQLTQELAEALHYAHGQSVVHRDIKPANILVTEGFHPKIADFGIARLNQAHMTLPGQVLGSPAYMAPEQLSGEGVDGRADLFSLGVVLYAMLTGHVPFQGNSATTVCFKVAHQEPVPVSAFDSQLSPEIDRLIARAIAKNPGERYQSGSEMACDIKDLREWGGLVRNSPALPDPLGATTFINSAAHAVSMATRASRTPLPQRRTFEQWLTARNCVFATVALVVIMSVSAYLGSRSAPNPLAEAAQTPIPLAHAPAPSTAVVVRLPTPHPHAVPGLNSAKQGAMAKLAHTAPQAQVGMAELQIEIDDPFADAKASVWLDNRLVYTSSIRGEATKHALLFRHVAGHESRTVHYPAGEHQVHVRVESTANGFDQSRTIAAKLAAGQETTLHVTCDKRADDLQVALQPAAPSH